MKRAAELRGLSEDHHGLVQARRLRKAAAEEGTNPQEAAKGFLEFWQKEISLYLYGTPGAPSSHHLEDGIEDPVR